MTREVTRRLAAGAVCAAVLLPAAACSSSPDRAPEPAAATTTPSRPASPDPSPSPAPTRSAGVPSPGSSDRPATSSGELSKRSFPTPRQLGAGWRYAVDPGDAEEGYAGNGTPALARNPDEIVQTAVPFGCPRRTTIPRPAHALEVDYALHGVRVISVRGDFGTAARARTFFEHRASAIGACAGRRGSAAIGPLVGGVHRLSRDAFASDRTPASEPYREVAVLDGDAVTLVAVAGHDPLTRPQTRRLVALFGS